MARPPVTEQSQINPIITAISEPESDIHVYEKAEIDQIFMSPRREDTAKTEEDYITTARTGGFRVEQTKLAKAIPEQQSSLLQTMDLVDPDIAH